MGGIGDWNAILRRKIEMISTALGAVASHYVGTNLRRYLGIAGALPLGMIGEQEVQLDLLEADAIDADIGRTRVGGRQDARHAIAALRGQIDGQRVGVELGIDPP